MVVLRRFSLTVALTVAWATSVWVTNHDEFSRIDTFGFIAHCGVVLLVQFLVVAASVRFGGTTVSRVLIALFSVFNFYTLILVHDETIAGMAATSRLLLLAFLFGNFWLLDMLMHQSRFVFNLLHVLVLAFFLRSAGVFAWAAYAEHRGVDTLPAAPDHFSYPTFVERPNVYLISFDALIPEPIARHFLDIDRLQYVSVMKHHGLRLLRNVFADRVPTVPSFNSLIAMDLAFFDGLDIQHRYAFDTGEIPGPLYELFRRNGYKIQFFYQSAYFGRPEGATVDFYGVAREAGICSHVDHPFAFMGFCVPAVLELTNFVSGRENRAYPRFLFERIRQVAAEDGPWLTLAYIYSPGHTPLDFNPRRREDFVQYAHEFAERRDPAAAESIDKLIRIIVESDPGAVLIIFGDHGAWMSRGIAEEGEPDDAPLTPKEVRQDRHAVVAAVYPENFCVEEFRREPYALSRMGRSLAKCLSGGKDVLPPDYQADDGGYQQYLYE